MKKIIACCVICTILAVAITAHLNCGRIDEQPVPVVSEANRELDPPGASPLVSIVWYKGNAHNPYKLISNSKLIDDILYRLQYKGNKEGNVTVQKPVNYEAKNLLAFVYYNLKENSYRVRYIPFEIKDGIFYWKYGKDKKVAQILFDGGIWNKDFHEFSRVRDNRLVKEKKAKEKYNIEKRHESLNQIKEALADEEKTENRYRFNIYKSARKNLLQIESFAVRQEVLDEIISELELGTSDLKESIIHAFAHVHKWMLDEKYAIDSKHISTIEQLNQKYDNAGLNHDEQRKLFEIHQMINKQVLAELLKQQDDFEKILKISDSNLNLIE